MTKIVYTWTTLLCVGKLRTSKLENFIETLPKKLPGNILKSFIFQIFVGIMHGES